MEMENFQQGQVTLATSVLVLPMVVAHVLTGESIVKEVIIVGIIYKNIL